MEEHPGLTEVCWVHIVLKGRCAAGWTDAPLVQLLADALGILEDPSPSPQAYVTTSYDLSSLQSDVGLLEFPGSPPSFLVLVTISIVLASKGLDLRQLEQEFQN